MKLQIKVVPGSSRDCVAGWLGAILKIRVSAAPERGKANAAVERILTRALRLPKESVRITSGKTSAQKTVEIDGLEHEEVVCRLSKVIG